MEERTCRSQRLERVDFVPRFNNTTDGEREATNSRDSIRGTWGLRKSNAGIPSRVTFSDRKKSQKAADYDGVIVTSRGARKSFWSQEKQ